MSGVSLTPTIFDSDNYVHEALVRLVSPNIQTIICGENLGAEPKSISASRRACWKHKTVVAMAFVGSVARREMESKTLGPCAPKLSNDLLTAPEAPAASLAAVSSSDAPIAPLQRLPSIAPSTACRTQYATSFRLAQETSCCIRVYTVYRELCRASEGIAYLRLDERVAIWLCKTNHWAHKQYSCTSNDRVALQARLWVCVTPRCMIGPLCW